MMAEREGEREREIVISNIASPLSWMLRCCEQLGLA